MPHPIPTFDPTTHETIICRHYGILTGVYWAPGGSSLNVSNVAVAFLDLKGRLTVNLYDDEFVRWDNNYRPAVAVTRTICKGFLSNDESRKILDSRIIKAMEDALIFEMQKTQKAMINEPVVTDTFGNDQYSDDE